MQCIITKLNLNKSTHYDETNKNVDGSQIITCLGTRLLKWGFTSALRLTVYELRKRPRQKLEQRLARTVESSPLVASAVAHSKAVNLFLYMIYSSLLLLLFVWPLILVFVLM